MEPPRFEGGRLLPNRRRLPPQLVSLPESALAIQKSPKRADIRIFSSGNRQRWLPEFLYVPGGRAGSGHAPRKSFFRSFNPGTERHLVSR